MRPYMLVSAVLAAGGCANDATTTVAYDEVAQSLGPQLVTDRLGDATVVAYGGVAPVERSGVFLRYDARCTNSLGMSIACGPGTVNAEVTAFWGNSQLAGMAHWS